MSHGNAKPRELTSEGHRGEITGARGCYRLWVDGELVLDGFRTRRFVTISDASRYFKSFSSRHTAE